MKSLLIGFSFISYRKTCRSHMSWCLLLIIYLRQESDRDDVVDVQRNRARNTQASFAVSCRQFPRQCDRDCATPAIGLAFVPGLLILNGPGEDCNVPTIESVDPRAHRCSVGLLPIQLVRIPGT